MKKILLILLLASPAFAGKASNFKDPNLNQEFDRNYYEHSYPSWVNAKGSSETLKYLNVSSITLNGINLVGSKVFQTVFSVGTGQGSTTSTTYSAGGPSVTITPIAASHRIALFFSSQSGVSGLVGGSVFFTFANGTTNLVGVQGLSGMSEIVAATFQTTPLFMGYIDSPATTSAVTYNMQLKVDAGTTTGYFGNTTGTYVMIAQEIL